MKAPEYSYPTKLGSGRICSICGCEVLDEDKHTSYRESLARLLGLGMDE